MTLLVKYHHWLFHSKYIYHHLKPKKKKNFLSIFKGELESVVLKIISSILIF